MNNDHAYHDRQRFLNACKPWPKRLQEKIDAALDYLGDKWILAEPIQQTSREVPAFLRKQAS